MRGRRSDGTDGAARRMIVAGRSCRLLAPIAGGDCWVGVVFPGGRSPRAVAAAAAAAAAPLWVTWP